MPRRPGVDGLWGRLMACRVAFRPRIRSVSETIFGELRNASYPHPGRENHGVARTVLVSSVDNMGVRGHTPVDHTTTTCWGSVAAEKLAVGFVLQLARVSCSQTTGPAA